jgi:hypothetical protein
MMGIVLAGAVGRALVAVGLDVGDVMLVSSGAIYEVARFELLRMPGVIVAPTVGGTDLPEAWYQTNEFTRLVAERIGGRPALLYAPALPAAELFQTLQTDQAIQMVLNLWPHARCHLNPLVLDVSMSIPSTTSTLATLVLPMTDGPCTALELLARNLTDDGLRDWRPVRHHVFLVLVRLISVGKGLQQPGGLGPEP